MYIYIIYIYFCLKSESNPFWMFSCFMSVLKLECSAPCGSRAGLPPADPV